MRVQGLEPRMALQRRAGGFAEGGEFGPERRVRRGVELPGHGHHAQPGRRRPIDQRLAFERGGLRPGDVHRGVQDVEQGAAGWRIGAEPVRGGGELRVHRADRDGRGAGGGGGRDELGQAAEIADAAIALAAQRVELDGQAPGALPGGGIGHRPAARRGGGQDRLLPGDAQAMVAGRRPARG